MLLFFNSINFLRYLLDLNFEIIKFNKIKFHNYAEKIP